MGVAPVGTENASAGEHDSANARQREKTERFHAHVVEMPDTCGKDNMSWKRKKREVMKTEAALHGAAFI